METRNGSPVTIHLQSGGKAIVLAGDDANAVSNGFIYFVDDSLGDNVGTIEADDVVLVATLATHDLGTETNANFF